MLYIVGMGPGHPDYLTQAAIDIIRQADCVIAFGRIANTAEQFRPDVLRVTRVDEVQAHLDPTRATALLASGDPCFYGIVDYLRRQGVTIDAVIPGLSSFQYLMAKLQKSWRHAALLSLHGRDASLEALKGCPLAILLTDRINTPHTISKRLQACDVRGTLYVGCNLSYPDEEIFMVQIGDDIEETEKISVMVMEHALD